MAADSATGRIDPGGCGSASLLYDHFNPGGDRNYQDRVQSDLAGIKGKNVFAYYQKNNSFMKGWNL